MTWGELAHTISNDLFVWFISYLFLLQLIVDIRGGPKH